MVGSIRDPTSSLLGLDYHQDRQTSHNPSLSPLPYEPGRWRMRSELNITTHTFVCPGTAECVRTSSGAPPALKKRARCLERLGAVSVHDGPRWLALGPPHWAWYLPKKWLKAQTQDVLDAAGFYTPALIDSLTISCASTTGARGSPPSRTTSRCTRFVSPPECGRADDGAAALTLPGAPSVDSSRVRPSRSQRAYS